MNILFTGGGGSGNEALWQHLEGKHTLFFGDADTSAIDPVIPPERRFQLRWADDRRFASDLLAQCLKHKIDVVVPCVDEELTVLAQIPHDKDSPHIWLSDLTFVQTMLDKLACATALRAAGLNAPYTSMASSLEDRPFPLLLKPRTGRGSRGVAIVEEPAQAKAYLALHRTQPDKIVAQELLRGQEYTVCVIPDLQGRIRAVIPVRVLSKRGVTLRAFTEQVSSIEAYAIRFQDVFRPRGPYNLQGILDPEGNFSVFEVNPRVSTTFCLALAASTDLLGLAFDITDFGEQKPDLVAFKPLLRLTRHWKNHIIES